MGPPRLDRAFGDIGSLDWPERTPPVRAPPRAGDVHYSLADLGKAKSLLGYQLGVEFEKWG
ncbi:hypothetical protein DFAR_3610009 [Desulfarculales bacterium]